MQTTVTEKGQIVIPARIRKKFGITKGTRILVEEDGDKISLVPITLDRIRKLKGCLKGSGVLEALMEDRAKEKKL